MKCIAIIVCGGAGTRMGAGENKLFLPLCGKTILQRTLEPFADTVDGIVLVHRPEDLEKIRNILASAELPFPVTYAVGGSTRQQSVYNGLQALPEDADTVLIHDGARCLVSRDLILAIRAQTEEKGSAIPAVPVTDTLKKAGSDLIIADTVDRTGLFRVQTPQGFRTGLIREAHELARSSGFEGTDDASIMEFAGHPVFLIPGENANMKMTVKEDLQMAEALLNQRRVPDLRVGQGYDVHKLVEGRDLILCGVTVPHETGLLGHSDADVAVHALMDALLGALALGDIGQHFPDKDPAYAGISSILLLQHVMQFLRRHHASVVNADVTIVAQRPKLAAYIPLMRHNLAEAMQIPESRVSVKATTTEHLGFEGEEKGISSQAICLLQID